MFWSFFLEVQVSLTHMRFNTHKGNTHQGWIAWSLVSLATWNYTMLKLCTIISTFV